MTAGIERPESAAVRRALQGTRFAKVRWVAETGSTNDDLLRAAAAGGAEQVLITDLQTAGRGRQGRVWEAPARSSILMSVLVRNRHPSEAFWAVGAVALGATEAVSEIADVDCRLKWPNDLMVGDAKVAGVLAQLVDDAAVVGIGINVNWPDTFTFEAIGGGGHLPTALNHHSKDREQVDRARLVVATLTRATHWLEADIFALRAAWKLRCSTLGRRVRLELRGESIIGVAVDIAKNGALVIDRGGERSSHEAGDVIHLRTTI